VRRDFYDLAKAAIAMAYWTHIRDILLPALRLQLEQRWYLILFGTYCRHQAGLLAESLQRLVSRYRQRNAAVAAVKDEGSGKLGTVNDYLTIRQVCCANWRSAGGYVRRNHYAKLHGFTRPFGFRSGTYDCSHRNRCSRAPTILFERFNDLNRPKHNVADFRNQSVNLLQ